MTYDVAMRKLRVPVALAFALVSCGGDDAPCYQSKELCVQAPNDPEPCPQNVCVDGSGACPAHCVAEHSKFFCIPDGTDAGVCPSPAPCILAGETCPAGCTPVG